MDIKNIKALAEILSSNGLSRLEVSEGDTVIKMEKAVSSPAAFAASTVVKENVTIVEETFGGKISGNYTEVKSPVVGVFYVAPSPDAPPFVTIGSQVKKGDVLCIVEAMKLMNEIVAEADGEIVDICLKNGDVAEFGQVLFKMA